MIDEEGYDALIKQAHTSVSNAKEEVYKQLFDEVQAAFNTWTQSGHQKHARAVFRNLEKVYARITGRAWR